MAGCILWAKIKVFVVRTLVLGFGRGLKSSLQTNCVRIFRVLKSANITTYRLTAVISIIERMSGIIGNLLYADK